MKILGIESSCDDTSISIVDDNKNIIANETISQNQIHKEYKGVVPELAARNHVLFIDKILKNILKKNNLKITDIDLISATVGPGLIGGLLVGLTFAKTLSQVNQIPFIGVNHLEGHALTVRLTNSIEFPFLLLLVSGGHSNFYFISEVNKYEILGGTLDDALGEAFDKVGNILGLDFPGGPQLEIMAQKGNYKNINLPKPLINVKNLDMSFSGLKTAVLKISKQIKTEQEKYDLAASFQKTIEEILYKKSKIAFEEFKKINNTEKNTFVVAGGVAANKNIRTVLENLCAEEKFEAIFPPINLCGDNAAMIAMVGLEKFKLKQFNGLDHPARPRWPLDEGAVFLKGAGVKL